MILCVTRPFEMKQIAFAQIGVFGRAYWGATYCHKKMACSKTPVVALMTNVFLGGISARFLFQGLRQTFIFILIVSYHSANAFALRWMV